ncbi:MAG: dTDP-4-dehydrorhamnose 3,5-epimerase [Cyclobacteriaceae bacterium]|jgi:dTDP-4-dehydrorhamnose 3,5-epimerase|nr:dTDP-4-dehydrorhamnose 3,5-epimerase [Cyclobacteriaceae bacterium]
MIVEQLELEGAFYIEPKIFHDQRGFFLEWFNRGRFYELTGVEFDVVQFNYSRSTKGVLRGLHYQLNPMAQAKLIAVVKGQIQDVIVDVRKNSKTFGQHYSVVLNAEKRNQLYIPKGFAHGFLVLSDEAEIFYAIDQQYSPEHDRGISFKDPTLGISWEINSGQIITSEKDEKLLNLNLTRNNF